MHHHPLDGITIKSTTHAIAFHEMTMVDMSSSPPPSLTPRLTRLSHWISRLALILVPHHYSLTSDMLTLIKISGLLHTVTLPMPSSLLSTLPLSPPPHFHPQLTQNTSPIWKAALMFPSLSPTTVEHLLFSLFLLICSYMSQDYWQTSKGHLTTHTSAMRFTVKVVLDLVDHNTSYTIYCSNFWIPHCSSLINAFGSFNSYVM